MDSGIFKESTQERLWAHSGSHFPVPQLIFCGIGACHYHFDSGPYYQLSWDLVNLSQIMYGSRLEK